MLPSYFEYQNDIVGIHSSMDVSCISPAYPAYQARYVRMYGPKCFYLGNFSALCLEQVTFKYEVMSSSGQRAGLLTGTIK